jgi:hypothetical protein
MLNGVFIIAWGTIDTQARLLAYLYRINGEKLIIIALSEKSLLCHMWLRFTPFQSTTVALIPQTTTRALGVHVNFDSPTNYSRTRSISCWAVILEVLLAC